MKLVLVLLIATIVFLSGCINIPNFSKDVNYNYDENYFQEDFQDHNSDNNFSYTNEGKDFNTFILDENSERDLNFDSEPKDKMQEESCVENPIFTKHITDVSKIENIVLPPVISAGNLKTHSYIETNKKKVPIYAPVDMELITGSFYVGGPYRLDFQVGCNVTLRLAHITEPLQDIIVLFPSSPTQDSKDQEIKQKIKFKAGDLIGYTTGTSQAGNWDFGVYDITKSNKYALDKAWNNSWVYTSAVCPYDYFAKELKQEYSKKYNLDKHASLKYDGEPFCK